MSYPYDQKFDDLLERARPGGAAPAPWRQLHECLDKALENEDKAQAFVASEEAKLADSLVDNRAHIAMQRALLLEMQTREDEALAALERALVGIEAILGTGRASVYVTHAEILCVHRSLPRHADPSDSPTEGEAEHGPRQVLESIRAVVANGFDRDPPVLECARSCSRATARAGRTAVSRTARAGPPAVRRRFGCRAR